MKSKPGQQVSKNNGVLSKESVIKLSVWALQYGEMEELKRYLIGIAKRTVITILD